MLLESLVREIYTQLFLQSKSHKSSNRVKGEDAYETILFEDLETEDVENADHAPATRRLRITVDFQVDFVDDPIERSIIKFLHKGVSVLECIGHSTDNKTRLMKKLASFLRDLLRREGDGRSLSSYHVSLSLS